jgi:hypothetical protein
MSEAKIENGRATLVKPVAPKSAIEEPKIDELDITDHSKFVEVKNTHGGTLVFEHGPIEFGEIGWATQAEAFYQSAFIEVQAK